MKEKLKQRIYQTEEEYWRLRAFLREVLMLNKLREYCWHVARLDYWRGHLLDDCGDVDPFLDKILLWETQDGKMVAALTPESAGQAYMQIHPEYRTTALEIEMIALAEEKLNIEHEGQKAVCVWANPDDQLRMDILKQRGYVKWKWTEWQWRRDLDAPIPEPTMPEGYTIRSLGDEDEIPARSWASWRGFHPDEPDEDYQGWEWYLNIQHCPLYRRDLDIVAIDPSGEIASFCTVWYDDATRTAYIEPVATVPEHLRRGLARATITEGLHRLQRLGATCVFLGGYEPGPNALYSSTLSSDHDKSEQWIKKW